MGAQKMLEYKYKVGNYVKFKTQFINPTRELKARAGTVAKITGFAPPYNNRLYYYINGVKDEVFPETVFERLATMADLRAEAGGDPEAATILYMSLNS
jgi:hypothetical protein